MVLISNTLCQVIAKIQTLLQMWAFMNTSITTLLYDVNCIALVRQSDI